MHHLFDRASRLAVSLFSPRQWGRTNAAPPHIRSGCEAAPVGCVAAVRRPSTPVHNMGTPGSITATVRSQHPSPALVRTPRVHTVRVLRRREGAAERLAIVGRMADVCAELDRLAAREQLC